jgi:hypothetical protein
MAKRKTDERTDCEHGEHMAMHDAFADLPGVTRSVPGNVLCANCREPLPFWWRGGRKLVPANEKD